MKTFLLFALIGLGLATEEKKKIPADNELLLLRAVATLQDAEIQLLRYRETSTLESMTLRAMEMRVEESRKGLNTAVDVAQKKDGAKGCKLLLMPVAEWSCSSK